MLWRCSAIDGYEIAARDGMIGSIDDMLFDEARWTVRWLVVDTGTWLSGRRVLLPPAALGHPDVGPQQFPVSLTRRQVETSPPFDSGRPVSRRVEVGLYETSPEFDPTGPSRATTRTRGTAITASRPIG